MATDPILDSPRRIQELHQQMDVQRATWRVQRVGWWIMLLFCVCGFLGLLGSGPLVSVTARSGEAVTTYDLVVRRGGDATVSFEIPSKGGRATLTLPSSYMEVARLQNIQPTPIVAFSGPEAHTFVFAAPHNRATVSMTVRPRQIGPLEFAPRVNGQALPTHYPLVLP